MNIPFIGPAYTERSPDLNAQTCVNLYPVTGGPDAAAVSALYGTPGLTHFKTIGDSPVRGMHVFGGSLFVVAGADLYRIDGTNTPVSVGTLASPSGRVAIADNGRAMMIVDGVGGYLWHDPGAGYQLDPITDPDFPGVGGGPAPSQVVFSGGYFIFDKAGGNPGEFMVSAFYASAPDPAGDPVDALSYATAEADPDGLVAIAALGGNVWMLGEATTEVWYHSGAEVPFDPIGGARGERGCAARWSVARAGESLLWLATDKSGRLQVVQSRGTAVEPVSTPALEFALEGYATVDDASAYAYHQEGHTFYVLNLPSGGDGDPAPGVTWVYDLTTGLWHRRGGWENGRWTRHLSDSHVYYNGRHLVGSHQNGKVYELDLDAYSDDGALIRRERTGPVAHADGAPLFFAELALKFEAGVGRGAASYPAWQPNAAYAAGDEVRATNAGVAVAFRCLTGGTSGTAEPSWNTADGATTIEGAINWQSFTPTQSAVLDWSDDGGHTWSTSRTADLGAAGEYGRRVVWPRLGRSRRRAFRVVVSDPVKVALLGAELTVEAGR